MSDMLDHLKDQLRKKGLDNPEKLTASEPTELGEAYWGHVSGGFTQTGFGQGFDQSWTPGFSQTNFTQKVP